MRKVTFITAGVVAAALAATGSIGAHGDRLLSSKPRPALARFQKRDRAFQRIATFANYRNNPSAAPRPSRRSLRPAPTGERSSIRTA